MNKKLLLGLGLLLLLGGGYFVMNRGKAPSTGTETSTQTETQTEPSAPNSLKDLLTSANAQKCTFSSTEGQATTEGTVYVANKQVRGDFKTTESGKTPSTSNLMTDGKVLYLWGSELGTSGIKLTIEASEEATSSASGGTADLNKPMDFNCSAWVVDSSVFELPAGVNFTEGFNIPTM